MPRESVKAEGPDEASEEPVTGEKFLDCAVFIRDQHAGGNSVKGQMVEDVILLLFHAARTIDHLNTQNATLRAQLATGGKIRATYEGQHDPCAEHAHRIAIVFSAEGARVWCTYRRNQPTPRLPDDMLLMNGKRARKMFEFVREDAAEASQGEGTDAPDCLACHGSGVTTGISATGPRTQIPCPCKDDAP